MLNNNICESCKRQIKRNFITYNGEWRFSYLFISFKDYLKYTYISDMSNNDYNT